MWGSVSVHETLSNYGKHPTFTARFYVFSWRGKDRFSRIFHCTDCSHASRENRSSRVKPDTRALETTQRWPPDVTVICPEAHASGIATLLGAGAWQCGLSICEVYRFMRLCRTTGSTQPSTAVLVWCVSISFIFSPLSLLLSVLRFSWRTCKDRTFSHFSRIFHCGPCTTNPRRCRRTTRITETIQAFALPDENCSTPALMKKYNKKQPLDGSICLSPQETEFNEQFARFCPPGLIRRPGPGICMFFEVGSSCQGHPSLTAAQASFDCGGPVLIAN